MQLAMNSKLKTQNSKLSVIWQSRWGIPIGYAISSEELALQLDAQGVELMHRPTPWHMPAQIRHPRLQQLAARSLRDDVPQVAYDQADLFNTSHPGYKIGYTMLEVDGLPPDWVAACNAMDEVWTPSPWGVQTFADAGVRVPLHVMPLGYDPIRFNTELPRQPISGRFSFLSLFEWGTRKGWDVLLRAYARAFRSHDDVLLILRINNHDSRVDVAAQIAALHLPSDTAPIALIYNQQIDAAQLGSLYRSADCLVLPTRGEGWGLPVLEAMACGLPVIATDWSAQTAFFNQNLGFPIRVRSLVPADPGCPYYIGFRWAEPDTDHLVELMRYVYLNQDTARAVGLRAANVAAQQWTWAHAAERITRRLAELSL